MRRAPFLLICGALVLLTVAGKHASGSARRRASADNRGTIVVSGTTRTYLLHVPASLNQAKPAPLVLVFHGGGGHARNMPRFTKFDRLADEQGFIVAYPEGLNKHWSDSRGLSPADDVGFVRALIAELERSQNVDPKRVYATGISNGGFFSQRLACDLADKVAAAASVAATMPEPLVPMCKPARPVSVMFMQGTEDPLVHIDGGKVARTHGRSVSLAAAASFWRNRDHTSSTPVSADLPDTAHDGTRVHRDVYGGGKDGTEVVVYTIEGGGHTWPGGMQYLPVFLVGKASKNLDATRTIWEFFARHSLP
ncbi:MAG TPA: PHB depolymerase family esterase [Terriglobales bacterium]|jgi:polyhydroxybutyrate depolymerase|nr:PHB depolymerase family esterase [Terriglobales bacterium]